MKIKSLQFALIILSILLIGPLYAQDQSSVSGVVKDAKTGDALSGASVYLKGTHIGGTAGEDGQYSFAKVPNGKWVLVCSRLSYIKVEQEIDISDKNNYTFSFSLKPDDITFSDVVITATRNEELVTSIPVATDVLTAKNIEESNAKNVGEALQNIGDSFIKSYGGVGSLETVSLRGSTDAQVLILIDGQRLNNAQSGSVDLSSIPTDAIERIEVVKGGNTAMYGSDAVGGVVNIITKSMARKNDLNLSANGLYGTYNTRIIDLSAAQGFGNFDYFLSYNRTQTDGNYPYTDVNGKQVNFQNSDTKANNVFFKSRLFIQR